MLQQLARAKQLRMDAAHLREGHSVHAENKELFLLVANDYEELAEALEKSAKAAGIEPET